MSDDGKEKMLSAIATMTEPTALRQVMKNATAKKRDDLYWIAFQRLCEVLGRAAHDPNDPIVWRLERSVHAFEELRGGRPASRTRQMMKRRGSVGTITQWLTYDKPTDGYVALVKAGLWHLLGEAIPLDFPEQFTRDEIAVARYRIADAKQGRISEPFLPTRTPSLFPHSQLDHADGAPRHEATPAPARARRGEASGRAGS